MATSKNTLNVLLVAVLMVALIGSNAFWLYMSADAGVSYSYMEASATENQRMLRVAVAVIPVIANPDSSKADVINAAEEFSGTDSFEKDGLVWIGGLGLGFDESDRVAIASDGLLNSFWSQT